MSDNVPDFDEVVDCLLAFREQDPLVYDIIEELADAHNNLSKSVDNDVESAHDLYLAQVLVKKLEVKHALATQCRIVAKNKFDIVYATAFKKINDLLKA